MDMIAGIVSSHYAGVPANFANVILGRINGVDTSKRSPIFGLTWEDSDEATPPDRQSHIWSFRFRDV
jgi:hypothetical protein